MTAAVAVAQFQMIELSKLGESPLNPRKYFDEAKQAELDASVAAQGVLEPLLVRPNGKVFEVVAGARRYRSAVKAKLGEVPCMVHELTDSQALKVALLENVSRSDISAVEEGEAFKQLVALGSTVEQLVEETGKSRTIVFARMKLAALSGEPRKALDEGRLTSSVAELIARVPGEENQQGAFEKLKKEAHYRYFESFSDKRENLSNVPVWHAREILDAEFRLVLKNAPFDVKDEALVAGVVACGACPKRTGADKALFPGVKEDHCLDGACWRAKSSAATKQIKAQVLEQTGKEIVRINRVKDQYGTPSKAVTEKFDKPGEKVDGEHTWKQLLGEDTPNVVAIDADNGTHNFVDKKRALALLEEKDPKAAAKVKKALEEPKPKDDWEKRAAEAQKKRDAREAAGGVVRRKALDVITKPDAAIALLVASWASNSWHWEEALEAAGLPAKTKAEKLKPAQRVRLLVAQAFRGLNDGVLELASKATKLDLKKLEKQALAVPSGTCFVCGCTGEKPCKAGGDRCVESWNSDPKSPTCEACGRVAEENY
jgi:ParB/RepB/Spo0J family partition protein